MSPPPRTALITGVTGQDGIYLARLLRAEGIDVVGTIRPSSLSSPRVSAYLDGVTLETLDIRDHGAIADILARHNPDEIYHLAAFTSIGGSWDMADDVAKINGEAVIGLLDAVLAHRDATGRSPRLFHASSAEAHNFGGDSPYGQAKRLAEDAIAEYRTTKGLHATCAVLHNHESPLRSERFVTRKITKRVAEIACGTEESLVLGNLDVHRDWGFAGDYVDAMRRIVRADEPSTLEVGTGISRSLAELVETAFAAADLGDPWSYVSQDPALLRPTDASVLVADPEVARAKIGWVAQVSFAECIASMVAVDMERVRSGVAEDPRYLDPETTSKGQP
jgi:GDPmannose 4,6-dehydratase